MDEKKKPTLEDCARYFKVIGNPQKLAIVLILYAAEALEKMETERKQEVKDSNQSLATTVEKERSA